ncbi:class I SAM-dependent methyltransferase [Mycolicibacterium mengxianglii]|uniref:class I SAM-dependent methyltransferase n=1 Tax=Mycolicibacterium mengxianglii TaxID=2736649 RepID=UPI0018EF2298|nr:class I SAM-dependent methyltransferase [Mycolicibacterium mengxianglii]
MSEAMEAEFGTVAEWTAQVAADLGPAFYIPAGCRGSGSPAALDWLIEHLELAPGEVFLDSGAGVGGPAAYAEQQRSVRPVLLEPEIGACRAAGTLFGFPVVQGSAAELPFADDSFDAAWSLGVMCTMTEQLPLLTELNRVVRADGRIGLLAFVARASEPFEQPEGNNFPTADSLPKLIDHAGLRVEAWRSTADMPAIPADWQNRVESVTAELADRFGETRAWKLAEQQSERIGRLLADGTVSGEMLVLQSR